MALISSFLSYIKKEQYGCYVISRNPLILTSYWHDFRINYDKLVKVLPADIEVWVIFQLGYYKSEEAAKEIKRDISLYLTEHPNYNFWFLNNSLEEDNRFKSLGLNSLFINQNAFLDEKRYKILPGKKQYDAIYLARFTPVKRHYLAKKIKNILLIGSYKPSEFDYYQESRKILAHADYKEKIWGYEVSRYMNKAQVGLCLSDLEGAMFVSTEYLLSGLPVVSTESLGGRDIYYHGEYAKIAPADPDSVADEVYKLIDNHPEPQDIRNETLRIMLEHRNKFIEFIQLIYDQKNINRDFSKEWDTVFIHKMGLRTRVSFPVYKRSIVSHDFTYTYLK